MNNLQTRTIRDWMTADPITVSSSTTLPEAYWLMIEHNVRRLLVVDDGQLAGIITMEDLRGSFHQEIMAIDLLKANEILSQMPIRQLMTKNPITITPSEKAVNAARSMLEHKISTLPVVESEKVVGIITESDLFRVLVDICLSQEAQKEKVTETETPEEDR